MAICDTVRPLREKSFKCYSKCFYLEGFVFNGWRVNVSSVSVVVEGLLKGMTNVVCAPCYFTDTFTCRLNKTSNLVKLKEPPEDHAL